MTKKKLCTVCLLALSLLLLCISCLIPTLSRLVSRVNAPTADGEQTVDFTVNNVLEVNSQEELFAAINQGYSYIQISKEVENPLIVTQNATNLDSDLILDLNGIEVQRNGSEPILNVGEGVRLTVVDSSEEQTGGLYNPVGSVFNINGGTLSVINGVFECGPRFSEYYSYNTSILASDNSTTKRTVVDNYNTVVYTDSNGTVTRPAPIIRSYPQKTGDVVYTHGNLYFDRSLTDSAANALPIASDTYCYYHSSENGASANAPAEASWHYSYYVDINTYAYFAATLAGVPADQHDQYALITIYGYENALATASNISVEANYHAAIRMQSGLLEVQEGAFFSYFGSEKTACINASGGTLVVKKGSFSTRIPNASTTAGGVTVKELSTVCFTDTYFNNFAWENTSYTLGAQARRGAAFCILNSGEASVLIETGDFYSSNNNSIKMSGGILYIGGGTLTKQNTIPLTSSADSGAAILMTQGNLTVANMTYTISGDYTKAIHMQNGELHVSDSSYTVRGSNTYGIYSLVSGQDNFTVSNTSFSLTNGSDQTGIYAANGRVQMISSSAHTISLDGARGNGVHAASGGAVVSQNYTISLAGANSTGIRSTGGTVSLTHGSVLLADNNTCYGVYAATTASGSGLAVTISDATINVGYDSTDLIKKMNDCAASVGVYLASPDAADTVTLTDTDILCYEVGVALSGGALNIGGEGKISTNCASAIAVAGGNLHILSSGDYTITSSNTTQSDTKNSYDITLPQLTTVGGVPTITQVSYPNTDGIYVEGGELNSEGYIDLTHKGLNNVTGYESYANATITSYAIRVSGNATKSGDVTITKGDIKAIAGGGICCTGGNITMGIKSPTAAELSDLKDATTGFLTGGITVNASGSTTDGIYHIAMPGVNSSNWTVPHSVNGGHAIELNGGSITVYNGTYSSSFGNGVYAINTDSGQKSTITLHNGKYFGGMPDSASGKSGPGSCYGLKAIGGTTAYIYNGHFDGGNGGAFFTGITDFEIPYVEGKGIEYLYTDGTGRTHTMYMTKVENPAKGDAPYVFSVGDLTELSFGYDSSWEIVFKDKNDNVATIDGIPLHGGDGHTNFDQATLDGLWATAYIYRGTFGNPKGADAFNAYDMATVVFGAHDSTYASTAADYQAAIQLHGMWTSIAMNMITNTETACIPPDVTVYYGKYNNNGISQWGESPNDLYSVYGAEALTIYNWGLGHVSANAYAAATDMQNTDPKFYSDNP